MEVGTGIQYFTLEPKVLALCGNVLSPVYNESYFILYVLTQPEAGRLAIGKALLEAGESGKASAWGCPGEIGKCQQEGYMGTQRTPERGPWAEPGTSSSQSSLWTYLSPQPLPPCLGYIKPSLALFSHRFCF